jgi:hypothetical protein
MLQQPEVVRSKLQVTDDQLREETRRRREQFVAHLKSVARYKSLNRIPVRAVPPAHDDAPRSTQRAATARRHRPSAPLFPKPPPLPLPQDLPSAAVAPSGAAATERQRPMSSRVRSKIVEMAERFAL